MAVQFKFRSSAIFDSINIGNQSFISIRDLKSEIVKKKHLNLSQDFDLIFSDSLSGQEFKDESIRIPSGSSVIIKRVPATFTPFISREDHAAAGCSDGRDVNHAKITEPPAVNVGVSGLDDFGDNLFPLPDEDLLGLENLDSTNTEKKDFTALRCSAELLVRSDELHAKDSSANEGSTLVMHSKPKTQEHKELERTLPTNHLPTERNDMPSELKCSLCKNFFKEAVMIPCCQHSFCEKCICLALAEDGKCPMCSSTKCKAEDLLPNVSLRQAIERFLKSQLLLGDPENGLGGPENDLHRYAPDGESGIQVKELSYAATIRKKDFLLNSSATKRRSNHLLQKNLHDSTDIVVMKCEPDTLEDSTEFQGENDPQSVVQTYAQEVDSCVKKDRFCVASQGGERNFAVPSRLQRGHRTCYRCGSPDHLIRDCPIAASSQANHWNGDASVAGPASGCAPLYWPGSPPNVGPFVNMYGGPGMMMYNTTMPPITPYIYPPYASSMYGGYPFPSGHMELGVGAMAPAVDNHCLHPCNGDIRQGHVQEQRNFNANSERKWTDHVAHGSNAQHDYSGIRHSDDSLARRSEGKHRSWNDSEEHAYSDSLRQEKISCRKDGRDPKISQSDKSTSERDMHDFRNHPVEDRHEKHHKSSRMTVEKRAQYAIDSKKEITKRRVEDGEKRSHKEFHHHSRSIREHSYSSDSAKQRREGSSHRYKHPQKSVESNDKKYPHDRERTNENSDDDYRAHYHGHKRKRFH